MMMAVMITLRNEPGPLGTLGIHVVPFLDELDREHGLVIEGIEAGGRIDCDGRLSLYDRIVEINGRGLLNVEFADAQEIIRNALLSNEITLKVFKSGISSVPSTPTSTSTAADSPLVPPPTNSTSVHLPLLPGSSQPPQGTSPKVARKIDFEEGLVEGEQRAQITKTATVTPTKKLAVVSGGSGRRPNLSTPSHHSGSSSVAPSAALVAGNTRKIGRKYHIRLVKSHEGLGFSITTRDNPAGGNCPVYIKNILSRGAAIHDGRLKQGDRLLEVNGVEMTGKSQNEAASFLKNIPVGQQVDLIISRQESQVSAVASSAASGAVEPSYSPKLPRQLPPEKASETRETGRQREVLAFEIPLNDTGSAGLGLSVKGKTLTDTDGQTTDLGIFIKTVIHGGAASKDGRVKPNDQLVSVNNTPLLGLSNSDAMQTLRQKMLDNECSTPGNMILTIARRVPDTHQQASSASGSTSPSSPCDPTLSTTTSFNHHQRNNSILSAVSTDSGVEHLLSGADTGLYVFTPTRMDDTRRSFKSTLASNENPIIYNPPPQHRSSPQSEPTASQNPSLNCGGSLRLRGCGRQHPVLDRLGGAQSDGSAGDQEHLMSDADTSLYHLTPTRMDVTRRSFKSTLAPNENTIIYNPPPQQRSSPPNGPTAATIQTPSLDSGGSLRLGGSNRQHPVLDRLVGAHSGASACDQAAGQICGPIVPASHHQQQQFHQQQQQAQAMVVAAESIYSSASSSQCVYKVHSSRADVVIEHDLAASRPRLRGEEENSQRLCFGVGNEEVSMAARAAAEPMVASQIKMADSEMSLLTEDDPGFQRDGFGRQSMSEKRHAHLDAKHTDTYQRNKKAKEEKERQERHQQQEQEQEQVYGGSGSLEKDSSERRSGHRRQNGQPHGQQLGHSPQHQQQYAAVPRTRPKEVQQLPAVTTPLPCCHHDLGSCQSPGSCPYHAAPQQSQRKPKRSQDSAAMGLVLGLRKSSSLENLQTMMQDLQKQQLEDREGGNPFSVPRPATLKATRSRTTNESFRVAMDPSYDPPQGDDQDTMATVAEEGSESSSSVGHPHQVIYRPEHNHRQTSTALTSNKPSAAALSVVSASTQFTGLSVTTGTTVTTAASSQDESFAGLVRDKDISQQKKKGLFNKFFRFRSKKGKNPCKQAPNMAQITQDFEKEAERTRARRTHQMEQEKIQEHYRYLKEQQQHQQQLQHLLLQQQQNQNQEAKDDKYGHYMNFSQIQEQMQIYSQHSNPNKSRLVVVTPEHLQQLNSQLKQQEMLQSQLLQQQQQQRQLNRPPPLPPGRPGPLRSQVTMSSPTHECRVQQRPISNYFEYEVAKVMQQTPQSAIYEQRYAPSVAPVQQQQLHQSHQLLQQPIYGQHVQKQQQQLQMQQVRQLMLPQQSSPPQQGHYGTVDANALLRRQLSNHRIAPASTAPRTRQPVYQATAASPSSIYGMYHQQQYHHQPQHANGGYPVANGHSVPLMQQPIYYQREQQGYSCAYQRNGTNV